MSAEKLKVQDDLEPGIREFQRRVVADYLRFAPLDPTNIAERRQAAARVKSPWAEGGPVMTETLDLEIGAPPVRLRLYRPCEAPASSAFVYLHGGGWVLFDLDTHDRLMREYAARAGVNVIGVDYSRAPEAKFPVALDETRQVIDWLRSADGAAIAPSGRIGIGGDSAGANLALSTALSLRDRGIPGVDAVLLNYGAFDTERRASHEAFGGDTYMLTPEEMDDFWRAYLREGDEEDPLAKPLRADLAGLPPTFLCIAECDILADENHEMARRLSEAGVDVTVRSYEGATHSFLEAVSVSNLADRALADASEWLARSLRG